MAEPAGDTNHMLEAALAYAARRWPVFPCAPRGKTPLLSKRDGGNGLYDATLDVEQITAWWRRYPNANIGLRTGVAFDVLDIDGEEGQASMAAACQECGFDLPAGPWSKTGGGGDHVLFVPTGAGNRAGLLYKVDWRGAGGYIVAPPSVHPSGNLYRWDSDDEGDRGPNLPLEEAPTWLANLVNPPKVERSAQPVRFLPRNAGDGTPYGLQAMDRELEDLARAVAGTRNNDLNVAAFNLYQLVAGGELAEPAVEQRLRTVGMSLGLSEHEVMNTIRSARAKGMQQPRSAPELKLLHGKVTTAATANRGGAPEVVDMEMFRPFRRIPIDLRSPLPPVVTVGRYLYAGGLTVLQSEPGAGKSWFATDMARREVEGGHDVLYLDEEGGPDIVTERLAALGADPDAVEVRFHYFAFEHRRWNADDLTALDELVTSVPNCTLAVLDSLPDFLAAALLSEDSAQDVTTFVNTVLRRFRDAGIAQLLLDHLPKPPTDSKTKRSRYSRGSGAKLAKADATILLEVASEFDASTSGRLNLWKTKDRRGRLDLPSLSKPPVEFTVAVADGSVSLHEAEPVEHAGWHGPTECMAVVERVLREATPAEFSGTRLCEMVRLEHPFKDATIRHAAEILAAQMGPIRARQGARNATLYSYQEVF